MTNRSKISEFCLSLNEIIGYPYYFKWIPPTNYVEKNPDGSENDISYVVFKVSNGTKEKQLYFGHVSRIFDFIPITNMFPNELPISSFEDFEKYIEEIKSRIDYLIGKNNLVLKTEPSNGKSKYHFFWDGVLSNWHYCDFIVDGIRFNCAEQYMMHQKAIIFGDTETAKKILECEVPKKQKELGRQVKNFDKELWDKVKYELVKRGLKKKFCQNPELKDELLKLKGYEIVEASPEDNVWGIGFNADNALLNISKWGQNLLGKILTELANELQ